MVINVGRTSLPMAQHVKGKRSAVTCHLKCGDACSKGVCNVSSNGYFRDIVDAQLSRRALFGLGAVGAATIVLAPALSGVQPATASTGMPLAPVGAGGAFGFAPIEPIAHTVDGFVVPEGFDWTPIIRWGDPLFADSPAFDVNDQTPDAQARQFGYNVDYTDVIRTSATTAILFVNHEYTNEGIMFPSSQLTDDPDRVRRVGLKAHGLSVVELRREDETAPWTPVVGAPLNRRFLDDTPYAFTGPAAGSALLRTVDDPAGTTPLGTFGNCSGGTTPWGTILSGEENFNGYFRSEGVSATDRRYGLQDAATARGWEEVDQRFDARTPGYENEVNRFGWIVEVDPTDPTSTPRKHTSLGRLKHEGANVIVAANGKVVAYTGDDERFDYLYKFVSSRRITPGTGSAARTENMKILDEGTLYVATFAGNSPAAQIDGSGTLPADGAFDGTGIWIPLLTVAPGGNAVSHVPGMTPEQVAVYTRMAGDRVGATKMDRPEDVEPSPTTGKVYMALTNNTRRTTANVDEANPRHNNKHGQVVEITDDHAGTTFGWNLLLVCGDPAEADSYFGGFDKSKVSPISCPDNVAFDTAGGLWVSTDGNALGFNDGLYSVATEGPNRGETKLFLTVPVGAETCGPLVFDNRAIVNVQHPGETDGASIENPASHWPDGGTSQPRPSTVVAWRNGFSGGAGSLGSGSLPTGLIGS